MVPKPVIVSVPLAVTTAVAIAPPVNMTLSAAEVVSVNTITSAPASPVIVSAPSPPVILSTPPAPTILSPPALPVRVSAPAPPVIVSTPAPPITVVAEAAAVNESPAVTYELALIK